MTEEETQPTEQIEAPEQPIEQQENEQIEVPEQPNEDSNEQTGEDEEKDKNITLMSMKLRSQPPHRRLPTQIAELQDPELYDIERGVKKNPIQLRKGPHNRMPRHVVEFQDKVLFNPETQTRKNPIELRKSPRGRRYSHVVSAAMNGDPLILNSQLPYKLQYNNEAEDVIGSSAAASPVKSQKGNGNKNEEESGVESATSSSSNYQDSIPKSMSSLNDYNDFGNGSNSDNGEQKEQKENPLRSRTGPKRRVSSEVAPLLDQSKLEVKDRSANLPDFIEGVESNEYNQLDMNDTNNYGDNEPWVLNDEHPIEEIGEVKERKINLDDMLEGQELSEQPTQLDRDDISNYANNQPWVILPRFDGVERSINLEEDDQSYQTIGEDGRTYADNAPWVVQDEESLNNGSQQEPQIKERETVIIQQPQETEENYQTVGEDGRHYADSAPWVVQDEESLNNAENSNQPTEETQESHSSQKAQTNENEFNDNNDQDENYQTIGEDGRKYADGAPWVVQDEDSLQTTEESPKPEQTTANQNRIENVIEQQPETDENYQTVGEDGRKYADGAPWVVQDEEQLKNQQEEQENQEAQQPPEEGEAGEQEPESGATNEQPEEIEENYETIGEDGRKYADEAPWVVKDEDQLKDQQQEELVDRNQEIEEEPTTKPEEGPRKMKKKKNVKKVQVETQTNESYIKDHLKDNNKQTKSEVKTRSLNAEDKEPASQQSSSKSQNKTAQKQQATAKKQSTTANEPKNSTKDKKQPATTAKKQPAAATTKKQPTTTTTKKQEEEKASESAKKSATTKSAKPTTTTKNNNTATTKKQPASSTTNNKPAESKTASGKQGTNEPKLDKNDPKNYADNQPWVVHEEEEAAKKPTTTTRSAKTTTSSKKQPESTSKKQSTTSEPKKSTTSSKKQPSTTESNSKQTTTSSSKSAQKKDTKKTNNTSSTAENKKPATKKTTKSNPENEVISGKPSKTQSKPLDKDDEKNYADNKPWVIHDESQNAASSSTAPKKTKTTTKKGSTPSNKQEQANKEEEKKQPTTTTRSAKIDNNTSSTKKQSTAKSTQKQPATNKTAKSQQQSKNTKTQQKKQANENESFKAESLDDLPPKVRNSPIGKKIMSAEKTTSEAWRKQGLLNSFIYGLPKVVKSPTKSKASKSDLYGESEMRDFIKKEINNRKDDNEYKFNVCIVGQHLSGKSTLLSLFTDELLQDMTTNESWKSTFIFIHDCSSFIPIINNYNVLYRNMVEVSVGCIVWSRPQLLFFKKDLENYLFDAIESQSLPKEGFLQDHDLSDKEVEKVDEYIDRDKVNELGEEIHQKWNDNDFQEIYQLIFELPMKLALSCKFDKFIYILDHVDDCISIQVNPKTETEENENNNEDNNEISLNQVMSEMLDNTNCIVSCHDHDKFIQLKKDFDIIDISTILNNSKNKNNNRFSVQIKEQPKKNLELTVDHLMGAPALLAEWEKMSETANLIKKAKNNEKVKLENTLRIQTQNLINVVYAGEIEQGGDKTVEKVQLLDKKRTSK